MYVLLILNNKKGNINFFHQLVIEQDRDVQPRLHFIALLFMFPKLRYYIYTDNVVDQSFC
jgi:hypothetical protein